MWASNHDVLSYKYACHLIRINDCDMTITTPQLINLGFDESWFKDVLSEYFSVRLNEESRL